MVKRMKRPPAYMPVNRAKLRHSFNPPPHKAFASDKSTA